LASYSGSKTKGHEMVVQIRGLTQDQPIQQSLCIPFDDNVLRRLELLDPSIELRRSGPLDEATQLRLSRENIAAATDFMDVTQKMDDEEEKLLGQRKELSGNLFGTALVIVLAMFALAILLLWIHFRLLSSELA